MTVAGLLSSGTLQRSACARWSRPGPRRVLPPGGEAYVQKVVRRRVQSLGYSQLEPKSHSGGESRAEHPLLLPSGRLSARPGEAYAVVSPLSLEPPSPRTLWNASISRGPRAVKGRSAASLDVAGWLIRWEQRGERDNSRWHGVAVRLAELDEGVDGEHLD